MSSNTENPQPGNATEHPQGDDLGFQLPQPARLSPVVVIIAIVVVVGGAFAFGFVRHKDREQTKDDNAAVASADKTLKVEVFTPKVLASDRAMVLPGIVKALEETQIFARATGFVRAWHVDIGDQVKAGQLLAELDTPDLDAQVAQARAQLAQAKAAVAQAIAQKTYSSSNATRYQTLADQQLVAKSQVEQTQAQASTDNALVDAAKSNVAAQEANVRRLVDTQVFSRLTAPFAGTITVRNIERGALVHDTSTVPMFVLVATDPVRVFVDVPQTVAPSIRKDTPVSVTAREFGAHEFTGKVTRSAGSLDPDLHTMSTEIQVPNPPGAKDGVLLPGMYVSAAITVPVPHKVVEVPVTALYNDANGLRVATIDKSGNVKFVKITIERDTGATLQISAGLEGNEQIVKTAVATLGDGDHVETFVAPPPPAAGSGSGSGSSTK